MQAPKSNVGAWVKAGRSASKSVLDNFEVARAYSPDYTGMAIEGMKARTAEKIAAQKAEATVAAEKMKGSAKIAKTKMEVDAWETRNENRSKIAKAGMLAKAGTLLGQGLAPSDKPEKADYSALRNYYEKQQGKLTARQKELDADFDTESTDRATTPRTGTPLAGAVTAAAIEDNVQPAASQQTDGGAGTVIPTGVAVAGTKPTKKTSGVVSSMGFTAEDFDVYKKTVAGIESGGKYNIAGGSGGHYDGKYQMGAAAKTDAARILGIDDPGHSTGARANFRNSPQYQETMFEGYTKANHNFLMGNPNYANADPRRKLEILGYAHNQGMGAADKWLNTGRVGSDGFGTPGTKYSTSIRSAFDGL